MNTLDGETVRRRRERLGLSVQALGRNVDIPWATLDRIESGDQIDLRFVSVSALFRLADTLGVPAAALLRTATTSADPDTPEEVPSADVHQVAALLLTRMDAVMTNDIRRALGTDWDNLRIRHAIDHLNRLLEPTGMLIKREHGENRVFPIDNHSTQMDRHDEIVLSQQRLGSGSLAYLFRLYNGCSPTQAAAGMSRHMQRKVKGSLTNRRLVTKDATKINVDVFVGLDPIRPEKEASAQRRPQE